MYTSFQPVHPSQHPAPMIYAFLDKSKRRTLETTTASGLAVLLDRHEWPGVDNDFRRARFHFNVLAATKKGSLNVVRWWRTKCNDTT